MTILYYARYGGGFNPDVYGQLVLIEKSYFDHLVSQGFRNWEHKTVAIYGRKVVHTKVVEFYL